MMGFVGALMGASEIFSLISGYDAGEAQKSALELKLTQQKLQQNQKKIQMNRNIDRLFSHQLVIQASKGANFSSPNFTAIQRETLDRFQEDVDASTLNDAWSNAAVQSDINTIGESVPIDIAKSATRLAGDYINFGHYPSQRSYATTQVNGLPIPFAGG